MNRFERITKPLTWFMALLVVAFMAGCSSSDQSTVDSPTVVSVAVTPGTVEVPVGITQQFTATATYSDGLSHIVTAEPGIAWSSASPAIATVSAAGVATGVASGTAVITATFGGQSDTATLTVNAAVLQSIAVTPAAPSIPVTTTQQFTAMAIYDIGPVIDVTAAPGMVWSSASTGVATIVPATGLATAVSPGSSVITATFGGQSDTATLTVNAAVLQSISVTPATASVAMGLTQQFTATATYDVGPTVDVTTLAAWTSGAADATVGLNTGLATGVTANVTPVVITATFGGQTDTAALTVTAATLSSIAVTPAAPSIVVAGTQQFVATATYSDGTTPVVTADPGIVWSSSAPTIATIVSNTGLATGVAVGTTDITAAFGGQTSPAVTLTVTAAPTSVLPGIAGTPGANANNPTVNVANPSHSDTNVPTSTRGDLHTNLVGVKLVRATFNEAMNPTTINSSPAGTLLTFTLRETLSGNDVPGTVAMNTANTIATFTPTAVTLAVGTSYTATISTAAQNAGGTAIPKAVEWSFTTRAASSANQATPFVGQAPIDLLTAGNFAILAQSQITEADPVTGSITGDIGLSGQSGTFITVACTEMQGGSQIHEDDAGMTDTCFVQSSTVVAQAILDKGTAFLEAANRSVPDATGLGAGDISALTIYPGLYKWATPVDINTDVTLDGEGDTNAVWIFQISGDLTIAAGGGSVPAGIKVILTNGAKASNIFWQVAASSFGATLNNYSTFNGNIMSSAQVIMGTGAVLNGRAMAGTQVTLIGNTITQPAP